jgi:diguanylate cyclase (GGDEF)-like protein
MMQVVNCIATLHDPWIVLLAAIVCVAGGWVGLELLRRARERQGFQQAGWAFLSSVAIGSSVWCTHFIAMLAYEPSAPVTYDPVLTFLSLLIVILGSALALILALTPARLAAGAGGAVLGLTIAAMHYVGMMAYRVDGIIAWDMAYVVASVLLSIVFGVAALASAGRVNALVTLVFFVSGVVSLHFTGMTAVSVTPLATGAPIVNPFVSNAMAVAVAGVALLIVGTGITSFMIDSDASDAHLARLRHMALSDALTGLPNRVSFGDHLRHEITRASSQGHKVGIIGLDLDSFKEINDLRGHESGDEALIQIGRRLTALLRDGEFVARIGGDEFAAVKPYSEECDLSDFLTRIEQQLLKPIEIGESSFVTGASIGVSVYPQDGLDPDRLVGNADLAMYRAKNDPLRSVCYYEAGMDEMARKKREMATELRNAIPCGQMLLHFQVQTSVASRNEIVGYEVLLRWNHPRLGAVPPADFIPLAEETGQIIEIGEWVLREACREAVLWPDGEKIAVNLSAIQLADRNLPAVVHGILLETGLAPSRLELEITESSIVRDEVRALETLRRLRALGITIAIDDFGTGYSSLATLRSFPFDRIKLDRSFMGEIGESAQARAIVRAVLALGKSLKIPVLAEGVESEAQLEILAVEGCDEAQGFLLGRPGPRNGKETTTRKVA